MEDSELLETGDKKDPTPDENHKPHKFPEQANSNWCSCCGKAIINGLTNVLEVKSSPEKQLDFNGNVIGEEWKKPKVTAYLHGSCVKVHYGLQFDCEKCGGFSRYTTLEDGSKNKCICTCHKGSNHCSYILEPNAINNKVVRNLNGTRKS